MLTLEGDYRQGFFPLSAGSFSLTSLHSKKGVSGTPYPTGNVELSTHCYARGKLKKAKTNHLTTAEEIPGKQLKQDA
jgi:hypothetical protein